MLRGMGHHLAIGPVSVDARMVGESQRNCFQQKVVVTDGRMLEAVSGKGFGIRIGVEIEMRRAKTFL